MNFVGSFHNFVFIMNFTQCHSGQVLITLFGLLSHCPLKLLFVIVIMIMIMIMTIIIILSSS